MPSHKRRVIFSHAAERDLGSIYAHIASENPNAAERQVRAIGEACGTLELLSERGQPRPDLLEGLRQIVVHPYLVFYLIGPTAIEVARVLHGRRNIVGEFKSPGD